MPLVCVCVCAVCVCVCVFVLMSVSLCVREVTHSDYSPFKTIWIVVVVAVVVAFGSFRQRLKHAKNI
jgi:hypothetical protein